jgi:hypothetical protein
MLTIDRRLESLGARRPWANPFSQVTVLDNDFDDLGEIEFSVREQVRLTGCIRSSTLSLEAGDRPYFPAAYHWNRGRRPRVQRTPVLPDELYIPPDVKAPPPPMWAEPEPEREPWTTPTVTEAKPRQGVLLQELANMSEPEFIAWLQSSGHHAALAEYATRGEHNG